MINKISGVNPASVGFKATNRNVSYDVHNISPNEMNRLTLEMFNRGEITLKERLPFIPMNTKDLSQVSGQEVHIKYYSRVWDDPDRKRDMIFEFSNILKEQARDNDSQQNINVTQDALSLLKRIEQRQSFENVLRDTGKQKA
ncbi:MAG: hypothetical protein A4E62_02783 [Syntrophorhabdus sp. PtaU1.Bin002]|nr:MAG: hypothetical protein A4E62_02783 [Syntrophorhabdus sp. PtaU1.Bin002]